MKEDEVILTDILTGKAPRRCMLLEKRDDGAAYIYCDVRGKPYTVIIGKEEHDGEPWIHLSIAGKAHMPPYEAIREVKELFIGEEKYAISVMPPKSFHVNLHPYCFHWY